MTTYHAKQCNGPHGPGWYIAKRENGIESILPMFYAGDFAESEYEATALAHHLTTRSQSKSKMFISDNRARQRVNE